MSGEGELLSESVVHHICSSSDSSMQTTFLPLSERYTLRLPYIMVCLSFCRLLRPASSGLLIKGRQLEQTRVMTF